MTYNSVTGRTSGATATIIETPTPWGDMSDEEKGALLLAHHEGNDIEWTWVDRQPVWRDCPNAVGRFDKYAYRVKPGPEVKEVVMNGGNFGGDLDFSSDRVHDDDTHTITLPTLNDTPIPGTYTSEEGHAIKIEEIE